MLLHGASSGCNKVGLKGGTSGFTTTLNFWNGAPILKLVPMFAGVLAVRF